MTIAILMAVAVLFGALVLACILVGRMYEVRHKVGELTEELQEKETALEQHIPDMQEPTSKEKK